jgi:P27 family predicted phage terminase small subunit
MPRGPAPKPAALKRAQGNPGKQKLNRAEPQTRLVLPPCPDDLCDEGKAYWFEVGSQLVEMGILGVIDGHGFRDMVDLELRYRRLRVQMEDAPPVVVSRLGETIKNPLWVLNLEYLRERRQQHDKYGMTPASRSRLTATEPKPTDPLEAAMFQPPPPPPTPEREDEWSAQH